MPGEDTPWYKVRLRANGEIPRIWGLTTVYIDAHDGRILSAYDARQAHGPARLVLDTIYPLHTGQIGGITGRILQLLIGFWLIAMAGLGISLWWTRKRLARKKTAS
ncbi:MAG: PepSY domain-containing protein [Asticcacaulis sp.]|nr:PepSY domain-containing protein [Asticcacaulis sp.]